MHGFMLNKYTSIGCINSFTERRSTSIASPRSQSELVTHTQKKTIDSHRFNIRNWCWIRIENYKWQQTKIVKKLEIQMIKIKGNKRKQRKMGSYMPVQALKNLFKLNMRDSAGEKSNRKSAATEKKTTEDDFKWAINLWIACVVLCGLL